MNKEIDLYDVGDIAFIAYCEKMGHAAHGRSFSVGHEDADFIRRLYNNRKHATFDAANQMLLIGDEHKIGYCSNATVHVAYKLNFFADVNEDDHILLVLNDGKGNLTVLNSNGATYLNFVRIIDATNEQAKTIAEISKSFNRFFK